VLFDCPRGCRDSTEAQWTVATWHENGRDEPQRLLRLALRRSQCLRSVNRDTLSRDVAGYLSDEVAGRIIDVQREGTAVRIAAITESERLTKMDSSNKISVYVVRPHAVSELVGPPSRMLPRPEADVPRSRIYIRVVNLRPAGIPNLVRLLDGLIADHEPDVPKTNDGSVFGVEDSESCCIRLD